MPATTKTPRVPKLTFHSTSGQARVRLGGRQVYLGKHGSPEATEKYHRLTAEYLRTGEVPEEARPAPAVVAGAPAATAGGPATADPPDRTVDEVILAYWKWAEGYYVKNGEPTSELSSLKQSLKALRGLYGSTPAAEFGPKKLKAVRDAAVRDGLSRSGANRRASHVKRLFKWAVAEELVPPSVHQGLTAVTGLKRGRTAAREPEPVGPVDPTLVEATLPHLPTVVADIVRLQLLTGMRPGEVCSLRPADVDCTGETWIYRPASHKTQHRGRDRVISFGPEARGVLTPYLDGRPVGKPCFSPKEAEAERRAAATAARTTPASCGNTVGSNRTKTPKRSPGDQYDTRSYGRRVRLASEKAVPLPAALLTEFAAINTLPNADRAEIKAAVREHRAACRWSPNQLRYTRATQLRAKYGIELTRTVLGHSDIGTSEIYAERDLAAAERVMREVG